MTEYGRIHTDGSRSGGQPVIKTQHCPNCEAQAAEIERLLNLLRDCDPESMSWLDARDAALDQSK